LNILSFNYFVNFITAFTPMLLAWHSQKME